VQQQANASLLGQTLQAHSHMLAVALTEHHNFLLERERSAQQFAERAAREAAAEAALLEVKTKEAAKFPLGCIQLVQSLQSAGRHDGLRGRGSFQTTRSKCDHHGGFVSSYCGSKCHT
jgi:hypothetical protein